MVEKCKMTALFSSTPPYIAASKNHAAPLAYGINKITHARSFFFIDTATAYSRQNKHRAASSPDMTAHTRGPLPVGRSVQRSAGRARWHEQTRAVGTTRPVGTSRPVGSVGVPCLDWPAFLFLLVDRLIARWINRLLARSIDRSLARSIARSIHR